MNRKGFTLVELLAVITLLAIIALVAVPAVDNALKEGREKLDATQEKQIIKGAKEFFANNIYCLPGNKNYSKCDNLQGTASSNCKRPATTCGSDDSGSCKLSIGCIKENGYLPANITNISNEESYDDTSVYVLITKNNNNYTYEVRTQ